MVSFLVDPFVQLAKKKIVKMSLKIENSLVICGDDELKLFISYPNHMTILTKLGIDVGLRATTQFPDAFEGKYDLRIVESLLIQSW